MQLTPETINAVWKRVPWKEPMGSFVDRVGHSFNNPEGSLWWTSANREFYSRPSDEVAGDAIRACFLSGEGVELDVDLSGASEPEWWDDPETKACRDVLERLSGIDQSDWNTPTAPPNKDWPANRFLDDHRLLMDGKDNLPAFMTIEDAIASLRPTERKLAKTKRKPEAASALIREYAASRSPGTVNLLSPDDLQAQDSGIELGREAEENRICPVCDGDVAWEDALNEWACRKGCHCKAKRNLRHLHNFKYAKGTVTTDAESKGTDYTRCVHFDDKGQTVPGCEGSTFDTQVWHDDPCAGCGSFLPCECKPPRTMHGHKGLTCTQCESPVLCPTCLNPVEVGSPGKRPSTKLSCSDCSRAFNSDNHKEKKGCQVCDGEMRSFSPPRRKRPSKILSVRRSPSRAFGELKDQRIKYCEKCGSNTFSDVRISKAHGVPNGVEERRFGMALVGIALHNVAKKHPEAAQAALLHHVWRLGYAEIAEVAEKDNWLARFWSPKTVEREIRAFDAAFEKVYPELSITDPKLPI